MEKTLRTVDRKHHGKAIIRIIVNWSRAMTSIAKQILDGCEYHDRVIIRTPADWPPEVEESNRIETNRKYPERKDNTLEPEPTYASVRLDNSVLNR